MRLCSHVVKNDTGLAPNPFHGYCTSAVCTPSHMNLQLKEGDWLIGHSPKKKGCKLVYAMRIFEVLSMQQYYNDERFKEKKPKPHGTLEEQCGDNIYFKDGVGLWKRLPSRFHNHCSEFKRDIGKKLAGHPVFIAEHFYYFGCKHVAIPNALEGVIQDRQGVHYSNYLADRFVDWLEANHQPGLLGMPSDMADHSGDTGAMLTDWIADCTCQSKNQQRSDCGPNSRSFSETQQRKGGCR